jgi:hypothetical protein
MYVRTSRFCFVSSTSSNKTIIVFAQTWLKGVHAKRDTPIWVAVTLKLALSGAVMLALLVVDIAISRIVVVLVCA